MIRSDKRRTRTFRSFVLSFLAVFFLTACGEGALHQPAQSAPTPAIPGMPSCCCAVPPPSTPPVAVPTAVPTVAPPAAHRVWIVAVDPGHGGSETGAASLSGLIEKNVNLAIGLKLAALLKAGGFMPVLTHNSDTRVNTKGLDLNGNGVVDTDDDLQARVDIANAAHADILVSIHNDSSIDPAVRGTRVYYSLGRPFVSESIKLATALQTGIVAALRSAGYQPNDEGISDDGPLKKPYGHLFLLGPLSPRVARASNMPGALAESLYLSNPTEAALLEKSSIQAAIAEGYYEGIRQYFAGMGGN